MVTLGARSVSSLYARLLLPVDTARQGGGRAGIELVGPFPAELQLYTVFSAGLGAQAAQKDAGRALIDFLSAQMTKPLLAAKGLEPA